MAKLLPKISLLEQTLKAGKRAAHGGSALALGGLRGLAECCEAMRHILEVPIAHAHDVTSGRLLPWGGLGRPPKGSPPSDARSLG